jgi:glycerophosphoryl diester phosphodiesterase
VTLWLSQRSFGPLVVAHRGASSLAPENTEAAFRLAIARGAHVIETDGRLTADGIAVCMHDADLSRTAGIAARVSDLSLKQLHVHIPSCVPLAAAAALIVPQVGMMLDMKESEPDRVRAVLHQVAPWLSGGRILVGIRNAGLVDIVKEFGDVPCLALPGKVREGERDEQWDTLWVRFWSGTCTGIEAARARAQRIWIMMGEPTAEGSGVTSTAEIKAVLALQPDAVCLNDIDLMGVTPV